jgi:hypothetical protein
MDHAHSYHSTFSSADFESLAAAVTAQAPRMSAGQMLELADRLHELIRTRRVAELSFMRRHGSSAFATHFAQPSFTTTP